MARRPAGCHPMKNQPWAALCCGQDPDLKKPGNPVFHALFSNVKFPLHIRQDGLCKVPATDAKADGKGNSHSGDHQDECGIHQCPGNAQLVEDHECSHCINDIPDNESRRSVAVLLQGISCHGCEEEGDEENDDRRQ